MTSPLSVLLPDLSIVIVNWNSKELLRKCLLSLEEHCRGLRLEIIVVDGGSFDGCGQMIRDDFPSVTFVQSPENIGFGRSNNLGADLATSENLLLLNPDTEVRPGAVQTLLSELEQLPNAGILGARLENPDGSIQPTSVHVLPTPFVQAFRSDLFGRLFPKSRLGGHAFRLKSPHSIEVEAVSGACMMLKRATFKAVGGFSPEYFMYAEDMDLCFKIEKLGKVMYFAPQARVMHIGGGASGIQANGKTVIRMLDALQIYFSRNHQEAYRLGFCVAVFCAAALKLSVLSVASICKNALPLRHTKETAGTTLRWSLVNLSRHIHMNATIAERRSLDKASGSDLSSEVLRRRGEGSGICK